MGAKGISRGTWIPLLVILLLVIDQIIKVVVKTNMSIGESIDVFGDWFKICYVENEGFAFGMKLGGVAGKYVLTTFRLVIAGALIWWISHLVKSDRNPVEGHRPVPTGVLVGLSMILAGAVGNIIDCLFYGLIWDYASFMFGKVVDMFYFPIIRDGARVIFFSPVFNFADSCVTVGAFYLLLFQWKFFAREDKDKVETVS